MNLGWLSTIIFSILKTCGDFLIVRFYFSLQIFVTKHWVTTEFFLSIISLILLHISLYFFNNFSSSTKKNKALASLKFCTHPLTFGDKTHNSVKTSIFCNPIKQIGPFFAQRNSSNITILSIFCYL